MEDNRTKTVNGYPWTMTNAGRACRCNCCGTQTYSPEEFSRHWSGCPTRQRWGYIEPVIVSPS